MSDADDKKASKRTIYLIGSSHNGEHDEKRVVDADRAAELVENHLARYASE